jgi:sugar lactone lactonase YvrE
MIDGQSFYRLEAGRLRKRDFMQHIGRITRLEPSAALPGGEIVLQCEGLEQRQHRLLEARFNDLPARLVGASSRRIVALVPEEAEGTEAVVEVVCNGQLTEPQIVTVAELLADDLHPVANPAFDTRTGALYVTRSGGRGKELPVTIFRIDETGDIEDFSGDVTNPTGLAVGPDGQLYVSSRFDGAVYRVSQLAATPFAQNLGVATGIAFNNAGDLFVGDRNGPIYRLNAIGESRVFAEVEPSVAAFHLAFGPDDALYVTGPTVSSNDCVWRVDANGRVEKYFGGFMRPQGLAFDRQGNLYVAACYKARRGIWRIPPDGQSISLIVSGNNMVGLCFSPDGEMVVATTDAVYSLPLEIYGAL